MYKYRDCIAMILAGGQGSRLQAITDKVAKPAVSFGGKYRIIDFTLSNCVNSGIYTVGVLTQYQPLLLNEYIGNGSAWDLDRMDGGVVILPPYQAKNSADWYKGTANAVYKNINFIKRYNPENVLILSGDHIYKMDYSKMLSYHTVKGADCTIGTIDVPVEDASRFGILTTSEDNTITEFEEKPKIPKSTTASMGIYIFKTDILFKYLESDEKDKTSSNDFGKNIIPAMLKSDLKLYSYPFNGYWRDVGTVKSLWEADMDLLGDTPSLELNDRSWRIYSGYKPYPPQYIGDNAKIINSIITEGCEIYGTVENSVLSENVTVARGAHVSNSIIMSNVKIEKGSTVEYAIIDSGSTIGAGATIGTSSEITVVGSSVDIFPGSDIPGGSIYRGNKS